MGKHRARTERVEKNLRGAGLRVEPWSLMHRVRAGCVRGARGARGAQGARGHGYLLPQGQI